MKYLCFVKPFIIIFRRYMVKIEISICTGKKKAELFLY